MEGPETEQIPKTREGIARGAPQSQTADHAEAILRAIPDMMFRMSRDGVILDFKAEREADLYVPVGQIVGNRVDELLPSDLGKTIIGLASEVLDSGDLRTLEYELQKQTGLRSYEGRFNACGSNEVVIIVRDVTDSKQAQRELRQSAERLTAILGSLPVVLFALDMQGIVTLSEGKGLDALGLASADLIGKSAFEAFAGDTEILESFSRALAGEVFATERQYQGREYQARYAPVRDECGAVAGTIGVTVDVTEQRQANRALAASESRFRLLMEHSNDVLCELRDGRFTYISPNCFELSGKPPEYYIGRSPGELAHEDDLPKLAAFLAPGWTGHISATFRVRHADGDWRWREMSGVRIVEDGRARAVLVLRDIDARVKAEAAARAGDQKYAEVVKAARDIVYTHDLNGRFTSVNPAASALYGYAAEELLEMNFASFVDPAHLHIALENMQRAFRGEPMAPVELLTYAKDRTARWLEVVAAPIIEGGDIVGFQGIARDVTEHKSAEQALVRSEEKYRTLVETAQDIIYTTDFAGAITSVNHAVERILGYTAEEVVGRTTRYLVDESQHAALAANYAEWRLSGKMHGGGEWLARTKDGRGVWIETAATALMEGERPVGLLVIGRDVTERNRAVADARNAEEREAIQRERARIAQELHDNVAQYFFGIGIAAKDAPGGKADAPEMLQRRLAQIQRLSTDGGREVRKAIHALSSTELVDGLDVSLTRLFATFEEATGVSVAYQNELVAPLSPLTARELYAATREALYNIRKHAAASRIVVRLCDGPGGTTLEVADDGIGSAFAINQSIESGDCYGLRSLTERFERLGGRVAVINGAAAGVIVCCTLPAEAA